METNNILNALKDSNSKLQEIYEMFQDSSKEFSVPLIMKPLKELIESNNELIKKKDKLIKNITARTGKKIASFKIITSDEIKEERIAAYKILA